MLTRYISVQNSHYHNVSRYSTFCHWITWRLRFCRETPNDNGELGLVTWIHNCEQHWQLQARVRPTLSKPTLLLLLLWNILIDRYINWHLHRSKLKHLHKTKLMYSHHPRNGRVCWRFSLAGFWSPVWPVFQQMYPASLPLDSLNTDRRENWTNDIIDLHMKPEIFSHLSLPLSVWSPRCAAALSAAPPAAAAPLSPHHTLYLNWKTCDIYPLWDILTQTCSVLVHIC